MSLRTRTALRPITYIALLLCLSGPSAAGEKTYIAQTGDIIFHSSRSAQSLAIQKATHSQYSHMGMVYLNEGQAFVYEAVGPVKSTALQTWIKRGVGAHYVVKRLRDARILEIPARRQALVSFMQTYQGKPYDVYFQWSDESLYCSELVWKIYKGALNIELAELRTFSSFDLSDPVVKAKMRERFADKLPLNEPVISPADLFESSKLMQVFSN